MEEQLDLIIDVLTLSASQQYGLSIPVDFIKLSLRGMQRLKDAGRFNVIYGLAKGLGTDRPDGSGPCFPTSRMQLLLLLLLFYYYYYYYYCNRLYNFSSLSLVIT